MSTARGCATIVGGMWSATQEAAEMGKSAPAVSRARKDNAHPAHVADDGTITHPDLARRERVTGGQWAVVADPDAVRAFWATRRPGPRPKARTEQTEGADRG